MVTLTPSAEAGYEGDPQECDSWEELARAQLNLPPDFEPEEGDVLALEDRDCFITEWPSRRVFVLVGFDCIYLFDENGTVIDDPENFVPNGRQDHLGDHGFINEFRSGDNYYRLPPATSLAPVGGHVPDAPESAAVAALVAQVVSSVLAKAAQLRPPPLPPPLPPSIDVIAIWEKLQPGTRLVVPSPGPGNPLERCTVHTVNSLQVGVCV